MKILFQRSVVEELKKSIDDRNSKYGNGKHEEQVLVHGKNGTYYRRQNVGRKQEMKNIRQKKEVVEETKKKTTKDTDVKTGSTHTVGDIVVFKTPEGRQVNGTILAVGNDGCTIRGNGRDKGTDYFQIEHKNIKVLAKVNDKDEIRNFYDASGVTPDWRDGSKGMQPESCDSIEGLLAEVGAARAEFSNFSENVKNLFSSYEPLLLKRPKLKGIPRIKEKLRADAADLEKKGLVEEAKEIYDKDTDTYHCGTIRDCDGHTFCMRSIDDLSKLFDYLKGQDSIIRIKNNFANPSAVGYSDINMNIKLSNGTIAEIQLNTTANIVAKERYGHALYEVYRSIEKNPKYKELAGVMGAAQTKLYELSNKYSKEGTFPDVPGGNVYAETYKHEEYAKCIRDDVKKALPLFRQAKKDGVLDDTTVEHFEHLINYIK